MIKLRRGVAAHEAHARLAVLGDSRLCSSVKLCSAEELA